MKKVLPKSIGPYRILDELGEGGMAVVYLAQQEEPFRRRVALKVIKLGMDTHDVIARFESERQALALMDHPHIAMVFDAGSTEQGRPYFLMEYVAGIPITDYCDKHQLSVPERLELFRLTCQAIHHAHQKGIIHRDIKPSNVLVTEIEGEALPKVIDFGIAKATNQRLTEMTLFTQQGAFIGTPEYMSPEQAETGGQEVDTTTDVYSLGVLLHELLVGALPLDLRGLGFGQLERTIREQEPRKLTTLLNSLGGRATKIAERRRTDIRALAKRLGGELDWITRKALEKERARRYQSASELAADVERYLNDAPVQAGPPTTIYLLRKLAKRHKTLIAAGVASIILLLAFGIVTAIQANRIAQEAQKSQQVSQFLVDLFEVSDPGESRGNTITAREILDVGAKRIETELADEPVVQAELMRTMATVYHSLGLYEQAASLLEQAVSVRRSEGGDGLVLTGWLVDLGETYRLQSRYDDAEPLLQSALAILDKERGADPLRVATALNHLALVYWNTGRYTEAEPLLERAQAIQEAGLGPDHPDLATTLTSLALVYRDRGKYTEAEPVFERALAIRERALGQDHHLVGRSLSNLALVHMNVGNYAEAEPLFERSLAIRETALEPDHPSLAYSLHNLASLKLNKGRYAEAEPLFERALAIRERALGPDHPNVADSLVTLGLVRRFLGRYTEAVPLLERALGIQEAVLSPDHPALAPSLHFLGEALRLLNRPTKAGSLHQRALAIQEARFGSDHSSLAQGLNLLALAYWRMGRHTEAEPLLERALHIQQAAGLDDPGVAFSLNNLALVYRSTGRYAEAEPLLVRALNVQEGRHPLMADCLNNLAVVYRRMGRHAEAEPLFVRALALREKDLGSEHPDIAKTLEDYAAFLRELDRGEEAGELEARAQAIEGKQN